VDHTNTLLCLGFAPSLFLNLHFPQQSVLPLSIFNNGLNVCFPHIWWFRNVLNLKVHTFHHHGMPAWCHHPTWMTTGFSPSICLPWMSLLAHLLAYQQALTFIRTLNSSRYDKLIMPWGKGWLMPPPHVAEYKGQHMEYSILN